MGNREGLVQIQMADIRADVARAGQADLRVHVGAVHIDLAAVGVDDAGDLADAFLVDPMGARVSHHQTGQVILVQFGLFAQIRHVDIALLVAFHQHDLQAAHCGAGRIGAVCRGGYQRDIAVRVAARMMVGTDHQKAGVLALCPTVRLETHPGETGDLAQ